MLWLLTQHFGLRGRQEHRNMKVEDFCLQWDDDGLEYLTLAEGPTKTRQGWLKVKPRLVTPKMFATGNEERCPVMPVQGLPGEASRGNENHRPDLPLCDRQTGFKRMAQENANRENTIDSIMKKMKLNSPLIDLCPEKRITNHSPIGVRAGGAGGRRQPPQSRKYSGETPKIRAIKKR